MFIQKNSKAVVFSAVLAASLGFGIAHAWAVEGVISKGVVESEDLGEGSYCHLKFPAIKPSSLGSDHPVLQSAATGDMVDYYGPCDHDPLGKEEVAKQIQDEALYLDKGLGGGD
jgi:hypothetical protein